LSLDQLDTLVLFTIWTEAPIPATRRPANRWGDDGWQQEELTLVGQFAADRVAALLGRTLNGGRG
jgi:hypothetical protein